MSQKSEFLPLVKPSNIRLVVIGFDRCLTAINRTVMVDRSMLRRDKISQQETSAGQFRSCRDTCLVYPSELRIPVWTGNWAALNHHFSSLNPHCLPSGKHGNRENPMEHPAFWDALPVKNTSKQLHLKVIFHTFRWFSHDLPLPWSPLREAGRDFQHPRPQQELPGGSWVGFFSLDATKNDPKKDRPDRKWKKHNSALASL